MKIQNIVLIGSGNLATNLALAFHKVGINISCIYSRNATHASQLAQKVNAPSTNQLKELPRHADLYLITVSDAAIHQVVVELSDCKGLFAHTSGSIDVSVFADTVTEYGVFYPLMNFSATTVMDFANIPLCIEANTEENRKALESFANLLSNKVQFLNSSDRKIVHLAAVFACNFTNMNYIIAEEILSQNNIPFDLLRPLILETATKAQHNSPHLLQTGPAIRQDIPVIEAHLNLLKSNPAYIEIYTIMTENIRQLKHENKKL